MERKIYGPSRSPGNRSAVPYGQGPRSLQRQIEVGFESNGYSGNGGAVCCNSEILSSSPSEFRTCIRPEKNREELTRVHQIITRLLMAHLSLFLHALEEEEEEEVEAEEG